jgi:hypothetical protein
VLTRGDHRAVALVSSVVGCLGLVAAAVPASAAAPTDPPGTAQVGPVPVTAFSLSSQRLVDNDARPIGASSVPGTYNTKVTTVNVHTGVGNTGTVHRPTKSASVHASAATTAYLPGTAPGVAQDLTWVVRTSHGSTTVRHVTGDRWFSGNFTLSTSLSGNRFLYSVQPSADSDPRAYVLDTSTGRRTLVQSQVGFAPPAVFGDFVASVHADGSVWRRDLVSGARVELSGPTALPLNYGEVFAWGDYVGWNLHTGDDDEGAGPSALVYGYRDAKTLAAAHSLDRPIQQLSSAGVVLRTDHLSESDQPTAYDLQSYEGTTVPLLGSDTYRLGPQVEGRAMAWADPGGRLKIAQLDVPLTNPRYLGAPYEPATSIDNPTHGHYWSASLPFEGVVSNCSVQILSGSRVIQNRGCGGRIGEVEPAWDAVAQDGGPARAGTYTVRVYSRDGDPSTVMLDANGDARPILFTVKVGHPTRVSLHAVPTRVRRGSASVLSAHLTTTLGSSHRHRNVTFQRRLADGTWHRIGIVKTSAAGTARLRVRPAATAVYRAEFIGSRIDRPSTSATRRLAVHR